MGTLQMLEACLESHGVSVKDLHTAPVDMSTELCYNTATSRGPMRTDAHMRRNSGKHSHAPRIIELEAIMAKPPANVCLPFLTVHVPASHWLHRCFHSSRMCSMALQIPGKVPHLAQ